MPPRTARASNPGFGAARRERERREREESILAAAERVISRHGFHDAGMIDIAREAEFAIGTLYGFFESKEALFERLIVDRSEELARAMRPALDGPGSARERLERALAAKVEHMRAHLDFVLIYASTSMMATCGWGTPGAAIRLREENLRGVAEVIRGAKQKGEIPPDVDPADVALGFWTLSTNFLLAAARDPHGLDLARVERAMRSVFFDPLFGRGRVPAAARSRR